MGGEIFEIFPICESVFLPSNLLNRLAGYRIPGVLVKE